MLRVGLASVTFRALGSAEIIDWVVKAGLQGIEWAGDTHALPGDVRGAEEVRRLTEDAGLTVSSYGSYIRVGETEGSFDPWLDTAEALGVTTLRVWAGRRGSQVADADYRSRVVEESRRLAELAADRGMRIAYEFHGGTLTDTLASTLDLLQAVEHPAVSTYWQPPVGMEVASRIQGLKGVLTHLSNVHLFHWGPERERLPLAEGRDEWAQYLRLVSQTGKEHWLLFEFVKGDDPGAFLEDAKTLHAWLGERE